MIIFSEIPQRDEEIKLALSLEAPFIIDEHITVLNMNKLYDWLLNIDKVVDGKLYFDEFLKDIIIKGKNEGEHFYDFKGFTIVYTTEVNSKGYVFRFI